jgi:hypothetical protein
MRGGIRKFGELMYGQGCEAKPKSGYRDTVLDADDGRTGWTRYQGLREEPKEHYCVVSSQAARQGQMRASKLDDRAEKRFLATVAR